MENLKKHELGWLTKLYCSYDSKNDKMRFFCSQCSQECEPGHVCGDVKKLSPGVSVATQESEMSKLLSRRKCEDCGRMYYGAKHLCSPSVYKIEVNDETIGKPQDIGNGQMVTVNHPSTGVYTFATNSTAESSEFKHVTDAAWERSCSGVPDEFRIYMERTHEVNKTMLVTVEEWNARGNSDDELRARLRGLQHLYQNEVKENKAFIDYHYAEISRLRQRIRDLEPTPAPRPTYRWGLLP